VYPDPSYGDKYKLLYKTSSAEPEGKRLLRRKRRGWEDNIKMHLKIGREHVECIHLAYDRTCFARSGGSLEELSGC
jgi:hypothetical protein